MDDDLEGYVDDIRNSVRNDAENILRNIIQRATRKAADHLREAVSTAAWEWQQYVDVDSAPISCRKYVEKAFDEALAKENNASKN